MKYKGRVKKLEKYLKHTGDNIIFADQQDDGTFLLQDGQVLTREELDKLDEDMDGLLIATVWIIDDI